MLATLVLALILVVPTPLKRCANACWWEEEIQICGYWERVKCNRTEVECFDTPVLVCEPNMISLGEW